MKSQFLELHMNVFAVPTLYYIYMNIKKNNYNINERLRHKNNLIYLMNTKIYGNESIEKDEEENGQRSNR